MSTATPSDLLEALDGEVPAIVDHISAASLSTVPAFADLGGGLQGFTALIVEDLIRHADGTRQELAPSLIDRAHDLAHRGFDGGTVAHFWRVVSNELWLWLTTRSPFEFDLSGGGLIVWNSFLATHERYAT